MRLFVRAVIVILMVLGLATPAEAAVRGGPPGRLLGQLWHEVFTLPLPDNPFAGGSPCLHFHGVASVFGGDPDGAVCTIRKGTPLFIVGYSSECSTVEDPPYGVPGDDDDPASLRACARDADSRVRTPQVVLDGRPLRLTQVTSPLIKARLPVDNVFGTEERVMYAVAHGWVAGAYRLPVGTHTIVITLDGTNANGEPLPTVTTNTVIVKAKKH